MEVAAEEGGCVEPFEDGVEEEKETKLLEEGLALA